MELAIPFADLKLPDDKAKLAQGWRLNFNRARPARGGEPMEDTAWSPTGEESSHVPARFGFAFFKVFGAVPRLEGAKQQGEFPTLAAKRAKAEQEAVQAALKKAEGEQAHSSEELKKAESGLTAAKAALEKARAAERQAGQAVQTLQKQAEKKTREPEKPRAQGP